MLRRAVVLWIAASQLLPAQEPPTFRTGVNEILVDFVVRDKKGRPLRGLSQKDITVLEDGVPQIVTGFRQVESGATYTPDSNAPAPPPAGAPKDRLRLDRQVRLVSLVFERLGPDGRRFARQAALDFIERDLGDNVYYSIFYVDRGFSVLQQYTYDKELLKKAIENATGKNPRDFANDLSALTRTQTNMSDSSANSASSPGPGSSSVNGGSLSDAQAARLVTNMIEFTQNLIREDLGRSSVFSLWAIVDQLARMPGRKSVLYFSEGIEMPNSLLAQFRSMMSAANRANVAVYPIDARGLTTGTDQDSARSRLADAVAKSARMRSTETNGVEDFRTMDIALDSIYSNQQVILAELAESTGGTLFANTNDFRPFLRKLSEEFNTYYEVSYRPSKGEYDGRFRQIAVKVDRPDAVVQARNGYFSLPYLPGQMVHPYEVPLLNLLGNSPLPRKFEYHAAVLDYDVRAGRQRTLLAFDLPMKGLRFTPDNGVQRVHASFLALIKDDRGQVVDKLSRDLAMNQPADKAEQFRQGRMIFTRPVWLAPGRYTVESAVSDLEGNQAAAGRTSVTISPVDDKRPALSAITLVRRIDKPLPEPDAQDPMQMPAARVIPTLSDTIPRKAGTFAVFFLLYPDRSDSTQPQLIVEMLRDGKAVERTLAQLPSADADGNYPCLVDFSTRQPGQYEIRANVRQGGPTTRRSLFVNITE